MMTRARAWLVVGVALAGSASSALAETQAEIAARENDEGRDLMYASKYDEASAKFRDAVARVPEAKYFFNLCTSLFQEGKFGESLTACNSAEKNSSDDALKQKVEKMSGKIKDEAKKQGLDLQPVGGGGNDQNLPPDGTGTPNPPDGQGTNQQPGPNGGPPQQPVQYRPVQGRRPAGAGVFMAVTPDHHYTWTLGVDLYGGGGQVGQSGAFGNAAFGVRVKSDYLFNRPNRIGAQVYLQYTGMTAGSDQMFTNVGTLDIVDIGAALYKHVCIAGGHICVTPLLGASVALMSPNGSSDGSGSQLFNYGALGVRGELSAAYAFGPRLENVIELMGGFNAYSSVLSEPSDGSPGSHAVGLDTAGGFGYFGVGYTYRFNTPLGQRAFVTLE